MRTGMLSGTIVVYLVLGWAVAATAQEPIAQPAPDAQSDPAAAEDPISAEDRERLRAIVGEEPGAPEDPAAQPAPPGAAPSAPQESTTTGDTPEGRERLNDPQRDLDAQQQDVPSTPPSDESDGRERLNDPQRDLDAQQGVSSEQPTDRPDARVRLNDPQRDLDAQQQDAPSAPLVEQPPSAPAPIAEPEPAPERDAIEETKQEAGNEPQIASPSEEQHPAPTPSPQIEAPPASAEPPEADEPPPVTQTASAPESESEEQPAPESMTRWARIDALEALWTAYEFHYVDAGRVVSHDEGGITTSEGQGYAMLRSVWSNDPEMFERVWTWTKQNLRVRGDHLFAWKYKDGVIDRSAATDADVDIALALLLASRRFEEPDYEREALEVIHDIWEHEVLPAGDAYYPTAGDWTRREPVSVVHIGYLAPYAYREFAKVDSQHPWTRVADTSYEILHWIYFDQGLQLPPEKIYVDARSGALSLDDPKTGQKADFGYDAFPIFWRLALDAHWHWPLAMVNLDLFPAFREVGVEAKGEWKRKAEIANLHERMLEPLRGIWKREQRIYDRYRTTGEPLSKLEALPLYATVNSLAEVSDREFARELQAQKVAGLRAKAIENRDTPYYLHNWLWFDEALWLGEARRFDEPLGFLLPFDVRSFRANLPMFPLLLTLALFPIAHVARGTFWQRPVRYAFLASAFWVSAHYLWWRGTHSLNFIEPGGPFISISLWIAELYCFGSVILLLVQVGIGRGRHRRRKHPSARSKKRFWKSEESGAAFEPSVDVFIPIFQEPLEILDQTLIAACAMGYPNFTVHVLDDGHRDEVRALAESHGAHYIRGPREHAKAGNLNHALEQTTGEFVAIFDTDHIPMLTFLSETVPWFADPDVGVVQTPHVFRNPDIFQRAFHLEGRIPNEASLFNRGIQPARDTWGGAFFVGSGAVFRREALESIGGFQTLSIVEDIHTCTHLHAEGWRSVYVDKTLAVGLEAENLASYIVQRRRWMLGCLQVFFKDNPLFRRGLPLRMRFAYFGSLYHFFYPLARIVFWVTPLYYLFFHLHPIFSEVAVLTARLLPYLLVLPLISSVLMPRWPRPFWGPFYENVVSAPLARSMFDLFLPRTLGFKATPKGIVSSGRTFDWRSSKWTMLFALLNVAALAKGAWELSTFGIEKDAYFFNMIWASYNLLYLVGALLVAWERPQRRGEERVRCEMPARIVNGSAIHVTTRDISVTGCSLILDDRIPLPYEFDLVLGVNGGIRVRAELVFHERYERRELVGVRFVDPSEDVRRAILLGVFARSETWEELRARETRSRFGLAAAFLLGFARYFRRSRIWTRRYPTRRVHAVPRGLGSNRRRRVWLRDVSPGGAGLLCTGRKPRVGELWRISELRWGRVVHARRRFGVLWRVGIEEIEEPQGKVTPAWEHAA